MKSITNQTIAHRFAIPALVLCLLVLFSAVMVLAVSATPATDFVGDKLHEAGNDVKDMAKEAEHPIEDKMDAEDGIIHDSDGLIGNEPGERPAPQPRDTVTNGTEANKSRVGQIALWVILVAVIIAVLTIVALIPGRKKD